MEGRSADRLASKRFNFDAEVGECLPLVQEGRRFLRCQIHQFGDQRGVVAQAAESTFFSRFSYRMLSCGACWSSRSRYCRSPRSGSGPSLESRESACAPGWLIQSMDRLPPLDGAAKWPGHFHLLGSPSHCVAGGLPPEQVDRLPVNSVCGCGEAVAPFARAWATPVGRLESGV